MDVSLMSFSLTPYRATEAGSSAMAKTPTLGLPLNPITSSSDSTVSNLMVCSAKLYRTSSVVKSLMKSMPTLCGAPFSVTVRLANRYGRRNESVASPFTVIESEKVSPSYSPPLTLTLFATCEPSSVLVSRSGM